MARFLRNKVDGTIYDWNEILAAHPKCEEVTEAQAYPERYLEVHAEEIKAATPKRRGRPPLNLSTDVEEPPYTPTELDLEATKIPFNGMGLRAPTTQARQ